MRWLGSLGGPGKLMREGEPIATVECSVDVFLEEDRKTQVAKGGIKGSHTTLDDVLIDGGADLKLQSGETLSIVILSLGEPDLLGNACAEVMISGDVPGFE